MKYKLSLLVMFLVTLNSCKKNDVKQALLEEWPQTWIFTVDENVDQYTFIEIQANNTKRTKVQKSYSLVSLAEEEECEFLVNLSRSEDGKVCWTIQLEKDKRRWLTAHNSTNGEEVHLGVTSINSGSSEITPPGDSDNYKFIIHKLPDEDGVTTVAIESVDKPGYYISDAQPGFNYSPSQTVLLQETSPDKATHWRCR